MATLENHTSQILLLSESEKIHAKEAMLPISHTQWNEKRDMRGYCDQNVQSTRMRNMNEIVVSDEVSVLICFSMLYVLVAS